MVTVFTVSGCPEVLPAFAITRFQYAERYCDLTTQLCSKLPQTMFGLEPSQWHAYRQLSQALQLPHCFLGFAGKGVVLEGEEGGKHEYCLLALEHLLERAEAYSLSSESVRWGWCRYILCLHIAVMDKPLL